MKKVWIVTVVFALMLTLGTAVYAAKDDDTGFKQMLPQMQQMHPDVSEQELKEFYNDCKVKGNDMSGMMNGSADGSMQDMMDKGSMKDMMDKGSMHDGSMHNGSMQDMMDDSTTTLQ